MIQVSRTGKRSLTFEFDSDGTIDLLRLFQGEAATIPVSADTAVFSRKHPGTKFEQVELSIETTRHEDTLTRASGRWTLTFDKKDEVVDYAIEKLKECLSSRCFMPAELRYVRTGDSREEDQIYFVRTD